MSIQLLNSGLLWAVCTIALAGGTFSGSAANENGGGTPELSERSTQNGAPVTDLNAADSSIILTANRVPVRNARIKVFSPEGERLPYRVSMTDKNGFSTISIPEELAFKLEIKIGSVIYFTDTYTAPADIKYDPFNTAPAASGLTLTTAQNTAVSVVATI